jgi:hypothetical protein
VTTQERCTKIPSETANATTAMAKGRATKNEKRVMKKWRVFTCVYIIYIDSFMFFTFFVAF